MRESGNADHGRVLVLVPDGNVYALLEGSDQWGSVTVEGDVLFPEDSHNYLGLIYNHTERDARIDFGNIYIKGNGSYLRVNPHRDGNVGRTLYEEYRTPLTGQAAIEIGQWQRFKIEVSGKDAHVYVGDMATPQLTFGYLELTSGAIGFQPRCCGSPVWIDNIRVTSIEQMAYNGPPLPSVTYEPESLVTNWEVIGPLAAYEDAVARSPENDSYQWRPYETDGRGAVVTGALTDWQGDRTARFQR